MSVEDMMAAQGGGPEDTHTGDPLDGPEPEVAAAPAPKQRAKPGPKPKAKPAEPEVVEGEVDVNELAKLVKEQAETIAALKQKVDPVAPSAEPLPLYRTASVYPVDVEATQAMTGKKAAELAGVDYDELMSYKVRAPLNVDGQPIGSKRVLIVGLSDSSKTAVELDED